MNNIEEVKKILARNTTSWYREDKEAWIEVAAKQICQLFEPEGQEGIEAEVIEMQADVLGPSEGLDNDR